MTKTRKKTSLRWKFSVIISCLICFTMLSVGLIISNELKKPLIKEMQKKGEALAYNLAANTGEALLSGDELLLGIYLDKIINEKSISYAMILNKKGAVISHSDHKVVKGTLFEDPVSKKAMTITENSLIQYNSAGNYYDIAVPILSNNNKLGTIRLGFSGKEITVVLKNIKDIILIITALVLTLGLIISWMLVSHITKPIGILTKGVQIIGNGNLEHKIDIKTKDEIGQLAETFNEMTTKLKNAQVDLIEKERLKKEIQIAQQIQQSLLPKKCPEISGFNINSFYKAAKEIGGDYYDIFWINKEKLGIVIADVSGKGIPGSLGMALTRSLFRSQISEDSEPKEVLCKTNSLVSRDIKKGIFVSMLFAILNITKKTLTYANAGHNPLIIVRNNGKPEWTQCGGLALGIDGGDLFKDHIKQEVTIINKEDLAIFYTDGVTEAMNKEREEFGEKKLEQVAVENNKGNAKNFILKLNWHLENFTGGAEQNDDITIVALKRD